MNQSYERDLDLNLMRVFVVVAETGSVTEAANRLYLTQPAISAALRRLTTSVGTPLFVRAGRGLALTARGQIMFAAARPHLEALLEATKAPAVFDPESSERTIRAGLSDASEVWLLPLLLRALAEEAPKLKLIVIPVQFRTVAEALASRAIDLAVTVADELPAETRRLAIYKGDFVVLFDPRHSSLKKRVTLERYLACDHVIVSYNGDLRGIVEDELDIKRRVRVSVPSFHSVGSVVEGGPLVATIPRAVAEQIVRLRPRLAVAPIPFVLKGAAVELLWRASIEDDQAIKFLREVIVRVSKTYGTETSRR
jgi:LysR family transcriptional activator of mexEF-oprN operon